VSFFYFLSDFEWNELLLFREGKLTFEELRQQLTDVLFDGGAVTIKNNFEKSNFKPEMSLIRDLAMDSIQILTYLLSIEEKYALTLDYEDLTIEVFDNFNMFTQYFLNKITSKEQVPVGNS